MKSAPDYIVKANIQDENIRYLWDDWNIEEIVGITDDELLGRLQGLSLRSHFALLVGAAEWVIYRLEIFHDDPLPLEAVDAAWAQLIDYKYAVPWDPFDPDEWSGPVRRPIRHSIGMMQDCADLLHQGADVAHGAVKVLLLAEHVMPDKKPFVDWRDITIDRLKKLFPIDNNDPLGDPVPREFLDPDYTIDLAQLENLINQFLRQLDYNENQFLDPPDLMREAGFHGTPYVFNLQEDRDRRKKKQ